MFHINETVISRSSIVSCNFVVNDDYVDTLISMSSVSNVTIYMYFCLIMN